jgi:hypothetical protein
MQAVGRPPQKDSAYKEKAGMRVCSERGCMFSVSAPETSGRCIRGKAVRQRRAEVFSLQREEAEMKQQGAEKM